MLSSNEVSAVRGKHSQVYSILETSVQYWKIYLNLKTVQGFKRLLGKNILQCIYETVRDFTL